MSIVSQIVLLVPNFMWNLHVIEKAKGLFTLHMSIPKPEDVHTADCGVLSDI